MNPDTNAYKNEVEQVNIIKYSVLNLDLIKY